MRLPMKMCGRVLLIMRYVAMVSTQGIGTCMFCPSDTWCQDGVETPCSGNSSSPVHSNKKTDCVCDDGYSGPFGGPCVIIPVEVELATRDFTASIEISADEFEIIRQDYIWGVSLALRRPESDISILSVVEVGNNRRLLTASVQVETQVVVPENDAEALDILLTEETLNVVLVPLGVRIVTISTPRDKEHTTTPTPLTSTPIPDTPSEGLGIGALIGIGVGGLVLIAALASGIYFRQHNKTKPPITIDTAAGYLTTPLTSHVFNIDKFYNR
jgi:hypothetical protein